MKIEVLGTKGEIPLGAPKHRNHSGILIDHKFLFDLGEEKFLRHKPRATFITHLHPDHAYFVLEPKELPRAPVYAPEKKKYESLRLAKSVEIGLYRITPMPTHHSNKVKSCAYLIERGSTRLLYTGDIVWMDRTYRAKLGKLDCIITEASYIREGGLVRKDKKGKLYGHAGIPNIVRMFKANTDKIVLMHFGSWFFKDVQKSLKKIAALGEKYRVELIAAHDGMAIEI